MLVDLVRSITTRLNPKVMEQFSTISNKTDNNLKTASSKNSRSKIAKLYKEYKATTAVASIFKIDRILINLKIQCKNISKVLNFTVNTIIRDFLHGNGFIRITILLCFVMLINLLAGIQSKLYSQRANLMNQFQR